MTREPRQPNLFGEPPPRSGRRAASIGPAAIPPELRRIAAALPRNVRLGTSSWSFPGWEGLVYDRRASQTVLARRGLAAYARHDLLRAVGIDRTFYAPIPADSFADYAVAVPPEFRFVVKAHGLCTAPHHQEHGRPAGRNELFLDVAYAADQVVAPFVAGLGARAGPLVFQFSPLGRPYTREPRRFAEALGRFLTALPRGPLYAVELRDPQLLGADYAEALRAAGAIHCFNVHPRMPALDEQRRRLGERTAGPLVVRWLLHAGIGYQEAQRRYEPFSRLVDEDPSTRTRLAELAVEHARGGHEVFVTANNKAEGSAPLSVFRLAGAIADRWSA